MCALSGFLFFLSFFMCVLHVIHVWFWSGCSHLRKPLSLSLSLSFFLSVSFSRSLVSSPCSLHRRGIPISGARETGRYSLCVLVYNVAGSGASSAPPRPAPGAYAAGAHSPLEPLRGFVACFAICNGCARAANWIAPLRSVQLCSAQLYSALDVPRRGPEAALHRAFSPRPISTSE